MMPVHRYMDSNPHQRNQAPFPQHYFPGFEAAMPHSKVDPYKSPMMYESWPCNSNYGFPCFSCCNHGNFPASGYYTFRPPCPHFAPPPTLHHYPSYPTFPEPYPVYYVPPPHPSNEQPRYEYDKDAHANYHLCGCPNHPFHQKNDRSLKIEEQEPEAENNEGASVVPIQPRNYSYPVVWIPPEYVQNKDYGIHIDQPEMSTWTNSPSITKPSKSLKSTEREAKVWNGWFPLDMNSLKSLMQGDGETATQNHQNEHNVRQLPFPIFWVPSDGKQEEEKNQDKVKIKNASDHSKQAPVGFEFVPVEPPDNRVRMGKPLANGDISHNKNAWEMMGRTANEKCVPTKQIPVHKEDGSEGTEKKGRDVSVKRTEESKKDELGGTTAKGKSPSPPKSSRLPPVCLRVDPLPKKRSGNGSPTSPGTPEGQVKDTLSKASTEPGLKGDFAANTQILDGTIDRREPGEKERINIQVVDKRSEKNRAGESVSASPAKGLGDLPDVPVDSQEASVKPIIERTVGDNLEKDEGNITSFEEVGAAEKAAETLKGTNPDESFHGQCTAETKRMSDVEAAKLIQSAYRGFEVRKWEPLKKLKQIAKVREQMHEVRNRVQALESSFDLNKDDRQRLLIGETIMNLLLKLDTIQGLHSIVRDKRKSLARELVTLQEKLDSLTIKQVEEKGKELATAESANYPGDGGCMNAGIEEENENASAVRISSVDGTIENGKSIKEPDQEHLAHVADEQANSKDEETMEPLTHQELDDTEDKTKKVASDSECCAAPGIQDGDVSLNLEHVTRPSSVPEEKPIAEKFAEVNDLSGEGKPEVVEMDDLLLVSGNAEEDTMRSMPKGMVDQVHAVCEPEEQIGTSDGEKELDLLINPTLPAEVENLKCINKEQETDLLEELPNGIIEKGPAISEFEKCELHETSEGNTLPSTEGPLVCQSHEYLSEAASDNSVKGQKENEFPKSPELEEEVEKMMEEVSSDNSYESILKPEEVPSTVGEENTDKVHEENDYGTIPLDHMVSSESEDGSTATQEKEVLLEEKNVEEEQPVRTEEKKEIKLSNEIEVQEVECMNEKEKTTDMPRGSAEERVLFGTDAPSEPNVEPEFLPASPITGQKINDEYDLANIGGENRLIEENKKLREMVEKLIEAGKDQLTVISNLTGRVKDLEEKLSRNKKLGKPRYRRIYAPSYSRPMRVRGKAAEVAM